MGKGRLALVNKLGEPTTDLLSINSLLCPSHIERHTHNYLNLTEMGGIKLSGGKISC